MKIYYQGIPGAYSQKVSLDFGEELNLDIQGKETFKEVFDEIDKGNLGVIPIENSYAGSIHENLYHLSSYDCVILSEYFLPINHSLVSPGNDINEIKEIFSHPQGIMQCEKFLNQKNIKSNKYSDTAGAAKYVSNLNDNTKAAISSKWAGEIYGLNILKENIQDQDGNTTRFLFVSKKEDKDKFNKNVEKWKKGKKTIIFKAEDTPASLYKCLGAFATRGINLTKIESLPEKENPFNYIFWIDFEKNVENSYIEGAMKELEYFTKEINIIGDY